MKVGTDAVLLGSWCDLDGCNNAIDLGTGSGILSLMLAQRGLKKITSVELDMHAAMQASSNFSASPWPEKFETICADVHQLRESLNGCFDLIISNPPYFEGYVESVGDERNKARHATGNPEEFRKDWFITAYALGREMCRFCLIFPYNDEQKWLSSAGEAGWFAHQICRVKGNKNARFSRTLALFSKTPCLETDTKELCIETEKRGIYTEEYQKLTQDFYLERVFARK